MASGQAKRKLLSLTPIGWLYHSLTFVGECTLLFFDSLKRLFIPPYETQETIRQMAFIGVASIPIVALTSLASGAVISLYTSQAFIDYGATGFVGSAITLSITREIAPTLAGIMVAARCGSSMAAEIGSMNVTEQVDALRSLNVHPTKYLVIPRMLAATIMLPVLGLIGMYSGVMGGYLVAVPLTGLPKGVFLRSMQQYVVWSDVSGGLIKTVVFGLIVALVACQQGLRTRGGAAGVGLATTRTVVISMVLIYVVNYFLTSALYH